MIDEIIDTGTYNSTKNDSFSKFRDTDNKVFRALQKLDSLTENVEYIITWQKKITNEDIEHLKEVREKIIKLNNAIRKIDDVLDY